MAQAKRVQAPASLQADPAQAVQGSAQTEARQVDAEIGQVDADLASELVASGVTTQAAETVIAVLKASRDGASINAAAKASGINYRTAQRIVEAAAERRQGQLVAAS
jgi:response regulator of citrate/malate metabolism